MATYYATTDKLYLSDYFMTLASGKYEYPSCDPSNFFEDNNIDEPSDADVAQFKLIYKTHIKPGIDNGTT